MAMGTSKSSCSRSVIYSLYLLQYMSINLIMVISVSMWKGKLVTSRDRNQPSIFILGSVWAFEGIVKGIAQFCSNSWSNSFV